MISFRSFFSSFFTNSHAKRSVAFLVIVALFVSLMPTHFSIAWSKDDYVANLVIADAPETLSPGKEAEVEIRIRNIGKAVWYRTGENFVSLYHYDGGRKLEVASVFGAKGWDAPERPLRLPVDRVNPGEMITLRFLLVAPSKPGTYDLDFILVAEDLIRMGGGRAQFSIKVTGDAITSPSAPTPNPQPIIVPEEASDAAYTGFLMLRSDEGMTVKGSESKQFSFGFKNNGTATWKSRSVKVSGIQTALGNQLASVHDDSWIDSSTPISLTGITNPGELAFVTFSLQSPQKAGVYTARFQLYADNKLVEGAFVEIPITVTSDGVIEPEPVKPTMPVVTEPAPTPGPATTPIANFVLNPQPLNSDASSLPDQPLIRVGLLEPEDYAMTVKASHIGLQVLNNGAKVCDVPKNGEIEVSYSKVTSKYTLSGSTCATASSATWYIVRANDGISPITLSDYVRPVSWLPGANDNTFRAQLELRYASKPDEIWVINELPIESYLKGIAETSNASPAQFQRALLTGARTYAMYHVNRGTKRAAQNFTVDATYDQVYRGYGQEERTPTITASVDATRGQIVTYKGKLAITPYFSRSDGRTRNYEDVWGGQPIDWLKAVDAPGDQGKTLWGHGVGLSASSALYMDYELGKNYEQILKQFYTGIELMRAYK